MGGGGAPGGLRGCRARLADAVDRRPPGALVDAGRAGAGPRDRRTGRHPAPSPAWSRLRHRWCRRRWLPWLAMTRRVIAAPRSLLDRSAPPACRRWCCCSPRCCRCSAWRPPGAPGRPGVRTDRRHARAPGCGCCCGARVGGAGRGHAGAAGRRAGGRASPALWLLPCLAFTAGSAGAGRPRRGDPRRASALVARRGRRWCVAPSLVARRLRPWCCRRGSCPGGRLRRSPLDAWWRRSMAARSRRLITGCSRQRHSIGDLPT